tara:strand:+ start:611 stop:853 length:243 start_codon:yes stop_codon:yes gene_type:complete
MKLLFMNILAVFLPWMALFLSDNPGGAILALMMQATIIGWIPASMWAWRVVQEDAFSKRLEHKRKRDHKKQEKKKAKTST